MRDADFDLLWTCGFLHASNLAAGSWPYRALAAPVMCPDRYQASPVYFGDVIVRKVDPATGLVDLRDRVFAFNEEESFSGYEMLLRSPIVVEDVGDYLMGAVRTGSHAASIDAVLEGSADWAMIDSTVLDMVSQPGIRIVKSLGPYPAPPLLVSDRCDQRLTLELEEALIGLASVKPAQQMFEKWNLAWFTRIADAPYINLLE